MSFDANGWSSQLFSMPQGGAGGVSAVDAYGKNVANNAAVSANAFSRAGMQGIADYENVYKPYDKKIMTMVDAMGTDAYRSQQRGQAMTDVGIQAGAAQQAMARNMARMGVNPNSGAFAAAGGQMAMQTALGKAQAAASADRNSRDEYMKGLGTVNAMGTSAAGVAQKNLLAAAEMGKVGLAGADLGAAATDRANHAAASMASAAAAGTSAQASLMNAGTNAAKLTQDGKQFDDTLAQTKVRDQNTYDLGRGTLAVNKLTADNTAKANSFGNVVGSTAAGGLARWLTSPGGMQTMGNLYSSGTNSSGYTLADGSFSVVPPGSYTSLPQIDGVNWGEDWLDF